MAYTKFVLLGDGIIFLLWRQLYALEKGKVRLKTITLFSQQER